MGYVVDAMNKVERTKRSRAAAGAESFDPQTIDAMPFKKLRTPSHDDQPHLHLVDDSPQSATRAGVDPIAALSAEDVASFDARLVAAVAPTSLISEEYRAIRTQILARNSHRRHLAHVFTSTAPREGTTLTCLNLGLVFSELSERTTVIVEANLRAPVFSAMLGLGDAPGLSDCLSGRRSLDQTLRPIGRPNLAVLPAGTQTGHHGAHWLASPAFTDVLAALRDRFDHVIIDTAAALELADAGIVGSQCDEVILVVRANTTPRPMIEQAMGTLAGYNATVKGIVMAAVKTPASRYRYKGR